MILSTKRLKQILICIRRERFTWKERHIMLTLSFYLDDLLSIDEKPEAAINHIGETFRIKEGSIGFPKMYLGANVREWNSCYSLTTLWNKVYNFYPFELILRFHNQLLNKQLIFNRNCRDTSESNRQRREYIVNMMLSLKHPFKTTQSPILTTYKYSEINHLKSSQFTFRN